MQDEPWYSVRCVFRHDDLSERAPGTVYEERLVLVRAASFEEALAKGEAEAREYADGFETTYIDYADVFHLSADNVGDGTEVFSLMRTSDLGDDEFVARYFDDGTQHSKTFDEPEQT